VASDAPGPVGAQATIWEGGGQGNVVVVEGTDGADGGSNWYVILKLPELVVALSAESTSCSAAPFPSLFFKVSPAAR